MSYYRHSPQAAKKVANISGDVRRALAICRRAAENRRGIIEDAIESAAKQMIVNEREKEKAAVVKKVYGASSSASSAQSAAGAGSGPGSASSSTAQTVTEEALTEAKAKVDVTKLGIPLKVRHAK